MRRACGVSRKRLGQLDAARASRIYSSKSKNADSGTESDAEAEELPEIHKNENHVECAVQTDLKQFGENSDMLFTFAVLVSGGSFTKSEEIFSYVTGDFPSKQSFFHMQSIIKTETEKIIT